MKITAKLGEKQIELPNEFTWEQYMRLKKYQNANPNSIQILSAATGLPEKEIKKADLKSIEEISEILSLFYFSGTTSDQTITHFSHNGKEYGLQTDFGKLSFGSWIDLEVYSVGNIEENIPKILANLYYPIKKWKNGKYILEDYSSDLVEETAEEFKTIPIKIWYGATSFFLLFVNTYIGSIKTSMKWKNKILNYQLMGMKILPKFLRKRLSLDSILVR